MKTKKFNIFTRPVVTALVILAATLTGAFFKLPDGAYIHIGDAFVYAAVLLLPLKLALPAAVIGTALADLLLGSYAYILPTIIIKALTVLAVKGFMKLAKTASVQDILACLAGAVTVVGYFVADTLILLVNSFDFSFCVATALDRAQDNLLQALACAVVYMLISPLVRKIASKPRPDTAAE